MFEVGHSEPRMYFRLILMLNGIDLMKMRQALIGSRKWIYDSRNFSDV